MNKKIKNIRRLIIKVIKWFKTEKIMIIEIKIVDIKGIIKTMKQLKGLIKIQIIRKKTIEIKVIDLKIHIIERTENIMIEKEIEKVIINMTEKIEIIIRIIKKNIEIEMITMNEIDTKIKEEIMRRKDTKKKMNIKEKK